MFTRKGWGCVFAAFALVVSAQATPQAGSSQHSIRAVRPVVQAVARSPQQSEAGDESAAAKLPVRRVILYKTGVGYFEHVGRVQGDQSVRVDFTSGQLNDVLQSLTILDLNGGRIAGVNYNSEAPLSQRIGSLHLPLEETTDLSKFYAALRGARLEVASGTGSFTGRLLSIERKTRVSGGTTLEVDLATLVSDTGEVRSVELTPAVSVRLAEHDVNSEVNRYLGLLSTTRQQDIRRMTIDTTGSGDRQLYVSYISEVPVWKTTYRIVLPSKAGEQPLLQGWAVVDNTVGEDWNDVELSLVAGAPQSFIQRLSQPYYARRPVIPLPEAAQLSPQMHEAAMMGGLGALSGVVTDASGGVITNATVKLYSDTGVLVASRATDSAGNYRIDDVPAGNYRAEFNSAGFNTTSVRGLSLGGGVQNRNVTLQVGSTTQTIMVEAQPSEVETEASEQGAILGGNLGSNSELGGRIAPENVRTLPLTNRNYEQLETVQPGLTLPTKDALIAARAGAQAAAQGADLGDLFEYKLKDRVTIHKNESSLVPIVQERVSAEKVSLWNASMGSPRPLRALWLTNSSTLTLDEGSFSVLENEAFAGEGLTSSIKPGEKRLLSYAADLGVRVELMTFGRPQRVTHVRIDKGVMIQTSEIVQDSTYVVRDDDTTGRTVLIEHPLKPGWLLADDTPKPDETTSAVYRFRVPVRAKDTISFSVRERQPVEARFVLTNLDSKQIELFVNQKSITPEIEAAFRKIVEQKDRVSALEDEVTKRDDETKKIYDDQARLRENLKALKGSPEERALTQRYTKQLNDQETRLETLQRESADFQTKQDQAQADLDKMIESLTLDTTI